METGTKEYYKKYYEENKIQHSKRTKEWKDKNGEKLKNWEKQYFKETYPKKKKDPKVREAWNKNKRQLNKKRIDLVVEFKKDKCCSKCKEKRHYVLDLHHLDPNNKNFNLGEASKYSFEKIKKELEKCILLCRNCHSEFHYLEKENNLTIEEYLK